MLPNKPRDAPRVNDRRVLDGIFWYWSGAPWRDLPECDFEAGGTPALHRVYASPKMKVF
jgi:transposase